MNMLQELLNAHPAIFKGREPRTYSCLPLGWFPLVDKLCRNIEQTLSVEELDDFECLQIKEKLGRLRFYFRSMCRHKVERLVDDAMDASERICSDCGARTPLRDDREAAMVPHVCHPDPCSASKR